LAFLNTQDQLREIEWGKKYLWDIKFEDAPEPFDEFFPAADVDESKARLETFTLERYITNIQIPHRTAIRNIRLTFFDDQDNTLVDWLDDWINRKIFRIDSNSGFQISSVASLEESVKLVQLLKFSSDRVSLIEGGIISYWVFPEGELIFNGSSSSDAQTYTQNFIIVGQSGQKASFVEND